VREIPKQFFEREEKMTTSKSQKVINTVRENPGIKASEVCEMTGLSSSFVSSILTFSKQKGILYNDESAHWFYKGNGMKLDEARKVRTVGDLKRAIGDVPDEWPLMLNYRTDEETNEAVAITEINSHWHGVLTFEHE